MFYDILFIPTDQTPSDIGLLAVWNEVPKWELPINLGVRLVDVESLMHKEMGGLKALHIWQSGRCKGIPPTWTSLLKAVETTAGPIPRAELETKVLSEKTWTLVSIVLVVDTGEHCARSGLCT